VDALPAQVSPQSGRLHARFNQTVTGTGRLSSSDPNLQNIPIQSEEGRKIRRAFIAEEGQVLISADYSQIELRVLAHMSQDAALSAAFRDHLDIHAQTARDLLGIPAGERVSPEMRRIGKTVNFGVVYGMSGFRLGRELGIPVGVAAKYIDNYFARYAGVRKFFAELEEAARSHGFVSTLFGRRRVIGDIDTSGRDQGFLRRAAINAPIQGTSADIIKMAMARIDHRIRADKLPLAMIMQIHDELVFECRVDFKEEAIELVRREMEQVVRLSVPLEVDVKWGYNWDEAH
jgi:DNA polymerase I